MKRLFLIRHAKSSWDSMASSDFDRPLNERGRSDVPKMAAYLKSEAIVPEQVFCSSANRAQTTAIKMVSALGLDLSIIQADRRLYLADVNQLQSIMREISDEWETVFLVGHNPTITDCVNVLAGDELDNVPTCGVYGVELEIDSWLKLRGGVGRKIFFKVPKDL